MLQEKSVLINQFVPHNFCLCFAFTDINFRGMLITFLTWRIIKTCVDQSEVINVGAQID